jgi:hypothetical protein
LEVDASVATPQGWQMLSDWQSALIVPASPDACAGSLVISQLYAGGGADSSTYAHDFVELHNRSAAPIALGSWSIQYSSATSANWARFQLSGTLAPGGYWLVRTGNAGGGVVITGYDQLGSLSLSATAGKFVLVQTDQNLPTGACPSTYSEYLTWGTTNCNSDAFASPGTSKSFLRGASGCAGGGTPLQDFVSGAPVLRNSTTAPFLCTCKVVNEAGTPAEADQCKLVVTLPAVATADSASTLAVSGLIQESGSTATLPPAGQIRAQFGWGPKGSNPQVQPGWQWKVGAWPDSSAIQLTPQANLTFSLAGEHWLALRVSTDAGRSWTYCDADGSGSNSGLGFALTQLPAVLVSAPPPL